MQREIEIRNKAEKNLRRIPKRDGRRIAEAIMALRTGMNSDVKRLTNFTPEYRLRVGDWRILFEADRDKVMIIVFCIAARPTDNHERANH